MRHSWLGILGEAFLVRHSFLVRNSKRGILGEAFLVRHPW